MILLIALAVFAGVTFLLVLTMGCFYVVRDIRIWRRERREGRFSVWYQRPMLRQGLKMIGTAWLLAFIAGGIWYILMHPSLFLPFSLIAASSGCVVMGIFLLIDMRQLHQKRQEGLPTVWQKSPKLLRHLKDMLFCLGYVFLIEGNAHVRFHGFPAQPFPEGLVMELVQFLPWLLAVILHFAANHFEVEMQSHSEEQRAAYRRHMQHLCSILAARANILLDDGYQHREE